MRDKHYNIKPIRMSEDTWLELRKLKKQSNLTWNLFLLKLMYGKSIQSSTNKKRSKESTKV